MLVMIEYIFTFKLVNKTKNSGSEKSSLVDAALKVYRIFPSHSHPPGLDQK